MDGVLDANKVREAEESEREAGRIGRPRADELPRARRVIEDILSQRLFAIILAVHAAENGLGGNRERVAAMLELIHNESVASLEDLRRLGALE